MTPWFFGVSLDRAQPTPHDLTELPPMPKSYALDQTPANTIRRPHLACDDNWIRGFLGRVKIGHIASRWDDQPFITPVNFWYDPQPHAIYFHTNLTGRLRANIERHPQVCFEAFEAGRLLPSNAALEFGIQYESAVAFGVCQVLDDEQAQRRVLYGLLDKYFPGMQPGVHYRPIQESELKRTAVYAMAITSWSGKRNWHEQAEMVEDWPPLSQELLDRIF